MVLLIAKTPVVDCCIAFMSEAAKVEAPETVKLIEDRFAPEFEKAAETVTRAEPEPPVKTVTVSVVVVKSA
jgi:hypothetical protein